MKKAVKRGLTQRLRDRVMGDSDTSDEEKDKTKHSHSKGTSKRRKKKVRDIEEGSVDGDTEGEGEVISIVKSDTPLGEHTANSNAVVTFDVASKDKSRGIEHESTPKYRWTVPRAAGISTLEQSMPADAVLGKAGAEEVGFCLAFEYS